MHTGLVGVGRKTPRGCKAGQDLPGPVSSESSGVTGRVIRVRRSIAFSAFVLAALFLIGVF